VSARRGRIAARSPSRRIRVRPGVPSAGTARTLRLRLLQRLEFLGTLGRARRVGKGILELSQSPPRAALEQMLLGRDLQRSLNREAEVPRALGRKPLILLADE